MKLNVFVVTREGKTIPMNVGISTKVDAFKKILQDKEGIPTDQQRLVYDGKQLDDGQALLISCQVKNESTLRLGEITYLLRYIS
jgi:hypothetical protein